MSSIRRWSLSRRGWQQLGFVVAEDAEMAEQRFYMEWTKRPGVGARRAANVERADLYDADAARLADR